MEPIPNIVPLEPPAGRVLTATSEEPIRPAIIVNPHAAQGRTGAEWPELQRVLRHVFPGFDAYLTDRPGHATQLTRQALRSGCNRIVSVGGDGTHFEVVNGFFENDDPINPNAVMAILPHGTGNDLARTLGVRRDPKSHDYLAANRIVHADLGRITYTDHLGRKHTHYWQNMCRIGIGGEVVDRANRNSKAYGGFLTFLRATVVSLLVYRDQPVEIQIDEMNIKQMLKELVIAKGQYDGGGMHVAPHARLDNGVFDVYVIGQTTALDALINLPKIYTGKLRKRPDIVKYFRARRICVASNATIKTETDGETAGYVPATVELIPNAIRVLAGPKFKGL